MKNKKIGIGSLSLLLVIIAFVWAFNIFGVCVGDHILATLNIPTWSNMANATGTHYTIFYSFIFLIPALILSIKYIVYKGWKMVINYFYWNTFTWIYIYGCIVTNYNL